MAAALGGGHVAWTGLRGAGLLLAAALAHGAEIKSEVYVINTRPPSVSMWVKGVFVRLLTAWRFYLNWRTRRRTAYP
jgi:hypothetical protein